MKALCIKVFKRNRIKAEQCIQYPYREGLYEEANGKPFPRKQCVCDKGALISNSLQVSMEMNVFNVIIPDVKPAASYVVRLRCIPKNNHCSVCLWTKEISIPYSECHVG